MKKISKFLSENFHFLVVKFSVSNRLVFVMLSLSLSLSDITLLTHLHFLDLIFLHIFLLSTKTGYWIMHKCF